MALLTAGWLLQTRQVNLGPLAGPALLIALGWAFLACSPEGSLPETVRDDAGDVEFLAVSQFVRDEHGVVGEVTNFDQVGAEGSINYTGAGYGATVRFDVETLDFDITVREEGFVNAMRDLHTGSDTGSLWQWTIDIAAVFLVVVALTGLAIQLFMRKRRVSALSWLAGGTVVTILLVWWALP